MTITYQEPLRWNCQTNTTSSLYGAEWLEIVLIMPR